MTQKQCKYPSLLSKHLNSGHVGYKNHMQFHTINKTEDHVAFGVNPKTSQNKLVHSLGDCKMGV